MNTSFVAATNYKNMNLRKSLFVQVAVTDTKLRAN